VCQKNLDHSVIAFELTLAEAVHEIRHAQLGPNPLLALESLQGARDAVTRSLQELATVELALKAKFND